MFKRTIPTMKGAVAACASFGSHVSVAAMKNTVTGTKATLCCLIKRLNKSHIVILAINIFLVTLEMIVRKRERSAAGRTRTITDNAGRSKQKGKI